MQNTSTMLELQTGTMCVQCGKRLTGNDNKRFCNEYCKNSFHNGIRKKESREIGEIITILKTNRRIIADLLDGLEIRKVSAQKLLDKKFVFRYHTHRRVNKGDGKEYIFCFDYGYLELSPGWYSILHAFKE